MDDSDTRRGQPAAHVTFAARHRRRRWRGDAEAYGRAGAILLGDLLLMWSVAMAESAGLERLGAARPLLDALRTEVGRIEDHLLRALRRKGDAR